jgi:hypothetical protein
MNSGKNLGFVLLFCSLASGLTACGDDYHYLAANVSLGGQWFRHAETKTWRQ